MSAFVELFVFGSWMFWLTIVLLAAIIIGCLESESGVWATVTAVIGVLLLTHANGVSVVQVIKQNPIELLLATVGWFAVGTAWAVVKWYFWVKAKYAEEKRRHSLVLTAPVVVYHKGLILSWMTYWPWSLAWTMVNDPIRKGFEWCFSQVTTRLQRIADRIYAA